MSAPPIEAPPAGWAVAEENRAGPPGGTPPLRRWPYPWHCALALSNDTDYLDAEAFRALHAFLCGTGDTALGAGLGLEVGASFFVWSEDGELALHHGTPFAQDPPASPETPLLVALARHGWLDTLHGFGDWREPRPLGRERARAALERLDALDLHPRVWVNHGHGYHMVHNVGGPWGYYQQGDLPGSDDFVMDLLREAGFRYYWTDTFFDLDKFGDHHVFDSQQALDAAVAGYDFGRFFHTAHPREFARSVPVFPGLGEGAERDWRRRVFNRTLVATAARDGRAAWFFKRFGARPTPWAGNLAEQIAPSRLDALEAARGAVVIYQHLGQRSADGTPSPAGTPWLPQDAVEALRGLATRQAAGRVLVCTTARLLDFLRARDHLVYRTRTEGASHVIRVEAIDCPVAGRVAATPALLAGLCFEVPAAWEDVRIEVDGAAAPEVKTWDEPGREALRIVGFPWRRLEEVEV